MHCVKKFLIMNYTYLISNLMTVLLAVYQDDFYKGTGVSNLQPIADLQYKEVGPRYGGLVISSNKPLRIVVNIKYNFL